MSTSKAPRSVKTLSRIEMLRSEEAGNAALKSVRSEQNKFIDRIAQEENKLSNKLADKNQHSVNGGSQRRRRHHKGKKNLKSTRRSRR